MRLPYIFFFFFNDTATTEIYTLSLHDALPISREGVVDRKTVSRVLSQSEVQALLDAYRDRLRSIVPDALDRKSTRLNSSHANISYAVFCLKKKKKKKKIQKKQQTSNHSSKD